MRKAAWPLPLCPLWTCGLRHGGPSSVCPQPLLRGGRSGRGAGVSEGPSPGGQGPACAAQSGPQSPASQERGPLSGPTFTSQRACVPTEWGSERPGRRGSGVRAATAPEAHVAPTSGFCDRSSAQQRQGEGQVPEAGGPTPLDVGSKDSWAWGRLSAPVKPGHRDHWQTVGSSVRRAWDAERLGHGRRGLAGAGAGPSSYVSWTRAPVPWGGLGPRAEGPQGLQRSRGPALSLWSPVRNHRLGLDANPGQEGSGGSGPRARARALQLVFWPWPLLGT